MGHCQHLSNVKWQRNVFLSFGFFSVLNIHFLIDLHFLISDEIFCDGLLPKNISLNENENLAFSFTLCGEPAPKVKWFFNRRNSPNEITPLKVKDFGYIYVLNWSALSMNMCGKDLSIFIKRSSEEIMTVLRIYINCELPQFFILEFFLTNFRYS